MDPLVTVFIPVYNSEKYIKECLDSVISQTYRNLEILIIDDGSIDDSCRIISNFNDDRIRLLHNGKNKGLPYTRNRGLIEARGKYFAPLDSDDICYINRIEEEVNYLENNIGIDVVTTDYQAFTDKFKKFNKFGRSPEETKIYLMFGCHICNSTSMFRMESVKKYGLSYNKDCLIAQDYEFWVQFSKYGKIANIPKILVKYRTGHENITRKTFKTKQSERRKIISSIRNDILDFYNLKLDEDDKYLFNAFFGESVDENLSVKNNADQLKELFQKLCSGSKNVFNEKVFEKVLYGRVVDLIADIPVSLWEKILTFAILLNDRSKFDIIKIINRHFYLKLRKFVLKY